MPYITRQFRGITTPDDDVFGIRSAVQTMFGKTNIKVDVIPSTLENIRSTGTNVRGKTRKNKNAGVAQR